MSNLKTHFAVCPPFDTTVVSACGRGSRKDTNVYRVDCLTCQSKDSFILAKDAADTERHARFLAQTPRKMVEPWHEGHVPMVCRKCGNDTFREGDRTCYGHYANFHCAAKGCTGVESRLTETGMSF